SPTAGSRWSKPAMRSRRQGRRAGNQYESEDAPRSWKWTASLTTPSLHHNWLALATTLTDPPIPHDPGETRLLKVPPERGADPDFAPAAHEVPGSGHRRPQGSSFGRSPATCLPRPRRARSLARRGGSAASKSRREPRGPGARSRRRVEHPRGVAEERGG